MRAVPTSLFSCWVLSSGSRKSPTLDLVNFLFRFSLEFGSVSWTAALGTGA